MEKEVPRFDTNGYEITKTIYLTDYNMLIVQNL